MNEPFLAYDCMRCRNEICADRESCLRWLTKDVRGVKGEAYPCKPDIFEATYESVEESHD